MSAFHALFHEGTNGNKQLSLNKKKCSYYTYQFHYLTMEWELTFSLVFQVLVLATDTPVGAVSNRRFCQLSIMFVFFDLSVIP